MTKLILVLCMGILAFGLNPTIKNALRNQVVIDFKNAIVPIISKQVSHIVIPDVHTSHSGFHIDVTSIYVDVAPFSPGQISIVFVPNSSIIRFSANSFSMHGHAHIHAKWHFIKKSFNADVKISNVGFDCEIALLSVGGKPNIKVNSLHIHLSSGNVHIHFSGGVVSKILEFLANLLKGHFIKSIVHSLESKLPPTITSEVNKRLNTLPSDIDIGQGLAIKYSFPYAPHVQNGYLFTGIVAYIHPKNDPNPPPFNVPSMPEFDSANPKGIQFFLADYVIKSAIHSGYKIGLYHISLEKDMLNHHVKMDCKASKEPGFEFKNAIDVTMEATCEVVFDRKAENHFSLTAALNVNLKEYIKQAIVFFSVNALKVTKIEYKHDKPIDINWFKDGINQVLDVVKALVNGELGNKGIPLPQIKGIDYKDTVQFIKTGYMEICTNPVFHFTMEDGEQAT